MIEEESIVNRDRTTLEKKKAMMAQNSKRPIMPVSHNRVI
jgi:hypothetical protein